MSARETLKGFHNCLLGDVITLQRGFDLPSHERRSGDIPVVSSSGITGWHNAAKVKAPGVVTGRYGTLGEVFYIEQDFWALNTTLFVSDFKGNHPKFISYLLRTLSLGVQNAAGAVPGVNRNVLHKMPVLVPEFEGQAKIADILSNYDRLIDNNTRRIALLEESIHRLYKEWFVYLRFPGCEKVAIVEGVPEGWELKKVKDFGTVTTGKTPSTKIPEYFGGSVPFIKTPDMHGNIFVILTEDSLTEMGANSQQKQYISAKAIMVACIGAKSGVVSLSSRTAQTNQQINSLIPNLEIFCYYCYYVLRELRIHLRAIGSNGATMINVNKNKFENMPVVLPLESLLKQFHQQASSVFEQILTLQIQNQKLREARDLLLSRLMNGSIAV